MPIPTASTPIRLFLCDDHQLVRQGVRRILEEQPGWEVVGEAADGRDGAEQVIALRPTVAIIDISMPIMNGIEATAQIAKHAPDVHVLILSMHVDDGHVSRAVQAGALGYLLKDAAVTDLCLAVSAVAAGKSFFSPAVARIMLDEYVRSLPNKGLADRFDSLSVREREILQLIAEGRSNKQTAELLGVSPSTIESHRGHILQKLNVHNTAELVLYAVRHGIIS